MLQTPPRNCDMSFSRQRAKTASWRERKIPEVYIQLCGQASSCAPCSRQVDQIHGIQLCPKVSCLRDPELASPPHSMHSRKDWSTPPWLPLDLCPVHTPEIPSSNSSWQTNFSEHLEPSLGFPHSDCFLFQIHQQQQQIYSFHHLS